MRNNNITWTIVGILIIIILGGYILTYDFFGIGTVVEKGINKIKNSFSGERIVECPDYIIPERITLLEPESEITGIKKDFSSTWNDGTGIGRYNMASLLGGNFQYSCSKGSKEGENINYFYCSGMRYQRTMEDIDKGGNIDEIEVREYSIDLVLKPQGNWVIKEVLTTTSEMNQYQTEISEAISRGDLGEAKRLQNLELNFYGIFELYDYNSVYDSINDLRWLYGEGEVWVEEEKIGHFNIYNNYSIVSSKCRKKK